MASKHHFECSICLELFTEPVSTPCGHNYCKTCITGFWSQCDVIRCPLCKETFVRAPKLRVNTEFRDILEMFKQTVVQEDVGSVAHPCDVPCDLCPAQRGQAVQSCLVCLASFCGAHLEPHHSTPALKWHQLVPPVDSLQERVCGKHKKVHQFFCRSEQQAVCSACTKDEHADHDFVPLEEEINARKSLVETSQRNVRRILSKKNVEFTKIQTSNRSSRLNVEMMKEEIDQNFEDLLLLLQAKKVELMEQLEENQKESELQAQQSLGLLQQEIHECCKINVEMEKLLQTGNDFKLLQGLPSIPSYPETMDVQAPKTPPLETIRKAVADIKTAVNQQMNRIMARVSPTDDGDEELDPETTENDPDDELGVIRKSFALNVVLDADTAHPALRLSKNRRTVRDGGTKRSIPDSPSRFDCFHYVLGKQGFQYDKFYFEVSVKGQTSWEVGVASMMIPRKGVELSLSPKGGCWTLGSYWGRCQANENPPAVLNLSEPPHRVGVFVDCTKCLVCFYDVKLRTWMYSFTQCDFNQLRRANLWDQYKIMVGYERTRDWIVPIFRPSTDAPLQIVSFR